MVSSRPVALAMRSTSWPTRRSCSSACVAMVVGDASAEPRGRVEHEGRVPVRGPLRRRTQDRDRRACQGAGDHRVYRRPAEVHRRRKRRRRLQVGVPAREVQLDRSAVVGAIEEQYLGRHALRRSRVEVTGDDDDTLVEQQVEQASLGPVRIGLFPAGQDGRRRRRARSLRRPWRLRRVVRRLVGPTRHLGGPGPGAGRGAVRAGVGHRTLLMLLLPSVRRRYTKVKTHVRRWNLTLPPGSSGGLCRPGRGRGRGGGGRAAGRS